MTIRPARESDLPELLAIYNYEVEHGVATLDLNPRTPDEWKEWFSAHQTDSHFILAGEENGAAIGYASLSEYRQKEAYASTAELSVYISPDFRRKGAGSALIGAVLDRKRVRNAPQRRIGDNRRKRGQRKASPEIRLRILRNAASGGL